MSAKLQAVIKTAPAQSKHVEIALNILPVAEQRSYRALLAGGCVGAPSGVV
jgi:hypothetical protein